MCFVNLEKASHRMPRKHFEWAMMDKGIPKGLVRSVMSLHEGAKTGVRVDYELSDEIVVNVGMKQGSVLSHFLSAITVDVTELAIESALNDFLYYDDFVLMSETKTTE